MAKITGIAAEREEAPVRYKSARSHVPKNAGSILFSTAQMYSHYTEASDKRENFKNVYFKKHFIALDVYLHNIYSFL